MKLYSIDSGKSNTCYFDGNNVASFPTKVTKDEDLIKGIEGNTHTIIYEGIMYKLGDGAKINNLDVSKNELLHKLSILLAIGLMMEGDREVCNVVTGTPINLFFTSDRDELVNNLKGSYCVAIDEVVRDIVIDKVLVLPESMGVVYEELELFKSKLVKVIDVGGLNTNGCIYENCKIVGNSYFTCNDGVNNLKAKIKNRLNKENVNYQDYEVEFLLRNGSKDEGIKAIMENCIEEHLESIKREMKANNWNVEVGEIIFTGGGSIVMKECIKKVFHNSKVSKNGLMDNVKGFYKVGKALCQSQ